MMAFLNAARAYPVKFGAFCIGTSSPIEPMDLGRGGGAKVVLTTLNNRVHNKADVMVELVVQPWLHE